MYIFCFKIFTSYFYKAAATAAEFRSRPPPRRALSAALALCPRPGLSSSISMINTRRPPHRDSQPPPPSPPPPPPCQLPLIGRPPFGQGQRYVRFTSLVASGRHQLADSFPAGDRTIANLSQYNIYTIRLTYEDHIFVFFADYTLVLRISSHIITITITFIIILVFPVVYSSLAAARRGPSARQRSHQQCNASVIYPVDPGFCRIIDTFRSSSLQVSYGWKFTPTSGGSTLDGRKTRL